MTVCPQQPNLSLPDEEGFATLLEPHLTFVKLWLGYSLMVYIKAGYMTDGATVPKEYLESSKFVEYACKIIARHYPGKDYKETLAYLIGTPFEMPRILAAIVHDALYDYQWKWRWLCDRMYRAILANADYDKTRREIEYSGIRLVGMKNWNAVTDLQRDRTRKIVTVAIVRNSEIARITHDIGKGATIC